MVDIVVNHVMVTSTTNPDYSNCFFKDAVSFRLLPLKRELTVFPGHSHSTTRIARSYTETRPARRYAGLVTKKSLLPTSTPATPLSSNATASG